MRKTKNKFRSDIQRKLRKYIRRRQHQPFEYSHLKKVVFGYSNYGGNRGKKKIKKVFGLREFKKDGRIWLHKLPKEKNKEWEQDG